MLPKLTRHPVSAAFPEYAARKSSTIWSNRLPSTACVSRSSPTGMQIIDGYHRYLALKQIYDDIRYDPEELQADGVVFKDAS